MRKIADWEHIVRTALTDAKKYNAGLEPQIMSLAGCLRTLELVNNEIDNLREVLLPVRSRYGNDTYIANPIFKVQKDTQDNVTKIMKSLDLTPEALLGTNESDPLIELTKDLIEKKGAPKIIRPRKQKQ